MNIFKDYSKILIIFLFTYFLILNLFQLSQQHWSSMLDQDIKMMYNSLLISSGIEQEYRDHPAYTTFFLLGSIYKICSIFFDNFTVQEILNSKNIDENLQTLFIIGRIVNGFYVFLVAFIIFNILKELNVNKYICIFSTLTIILFQDTYELLFLIRSEILSLLMILLFLYFLIKFIKTNKIKYTLLSGFFLCFSMLAKIQVIFLFVTFLISLPFLINHFKFQKHKNNLIYGKNYYILCFSLLVLFLSSYVFFQILLGIVMLHEYNDPRFYFTHNIDLFLFLIFLIFYSLYIKFLSLKKMIISSEFIINISSVLRDLRKDKVKSDQKNDEKLDVQDVKKEPEKSGGEEFTISEIDLLKQQLYACWTVPAGAKGAKDMVVRVRVWVNPDRTVSNARILDTNKMQNDPYFRTVAESALRAVLNPACSPLKLPPEKYSVWKKFIFKFELGWMLGN